MLRSVVQINVPCRYYRKSWDSAVGIVTGCGLDDLGVRVWVPVGSRIFSSLCHPDWLWGPSNLLSKGYWGCFPGGKQPGREADHSPPTSAQVKKTWIYTSTPHMSSRHSAPLVEHRDNFTFFFFTTIIDAEIVQCTFCVESLTEMHHFLKSFTTSTLQNYPPGCFHLTSKVWII
jgi:hypothetical protein